MIYAVQRFVLHRTFCFELLGYDDLFSRRGVGVGNRSGKRVEEYLCRGKACQNGY